MRTRGQRYQSPPRIQKNAQTKKRPVTPNQATVTQNQTSSQLENQTSNKPADVSLEDALNKLYTDINSAPSYSAKINDFLRQNPVHNVHKRIVKKKFPRRKIIARFPFDIWMGDLIEYPQYKFNNRQHVYILILIDCFTKKVYCAPMRDKSMKSSVKAFESVFAELDEFPTHIVTDGGLGKTPI